MRRFGNGLPLISASLLVAQLCAAQPPAAVTTLKAKSRIVVIDVVVTDKQGQPVKGLKAADFSLAENGATQTIKNFEAHTSLSAEDAAKLPPMPKLAPNIFTNYSPAPANGALNVLLLDEFNTKMVDKTVVLKQVLKYLSVPHPGARMEIFELDSDLHLLQGFSSDPEVLKAALMSRKAVPHMSAAVDGASGCTQVPGEAPAQETTAWARQGPPLGSEVYAEYMATQECLETQLHHRSLATLQAMEALARYMGGLPGRKNLLWFSASFTIQTNKRDITDEQHKVMSLFAKNQVAVYPIGARGLALSGPGGLDKLDSSKSTMEAMAEDTGGKVFTNSNDIAGEAEQAIDDGSNYYTLTYTPADGNWKGEFRKVQVKLEQQGYTLAYRPGYYAADVDEPTRNVAAAAEAAPDPAEVALHSAMEYGSPQPVDIVFSAAVNPATGIAEEVVAHANSLSPNVTGPFERYVISVSAPAKAFTFTPSAPGKLHMGVQLATCVYTAEGKLINAAAYKIDGEVDEANYQAIMANGMKLKQEISVPVKGESFLRIGVEDLATNRVGVVEIPVAAVAKLTPLAGAGAAQK